MARGGCGESSPRVPWGPEEEVGAAPPGVGGLRTTTRTRPGWSPDISPSGEAGRSGEAKAYAERPCLAGCV